MKLSKGKRLKSAMPLRTQPGFCLVYFLGSKSALVWTVGEAWQECDALGRVIACHWIRRSRPRNAVRLTAGLRTPSHLGCWRNGFKRPGLKHGPRSLTYVRVFGWQTHERNESECRWDPQGAPSTGPDVLGWVCVRAYMLGPERW